MAGSRYIDLITDAEEITQVRSIRSVVKRLCNDVTAHICGVAEWPFLWTESWFQTTDDYSTGTVSVANGSASVAGTDTVFTAGMVGRKMRIGADTAYYTIKTFTSTLALVLDQTYQGTTDTAATYVIYKDEYLLRADVDQQKRIRNSDNGLALFSLTAGEFDQLYPSPSGTGVPSLDVYTGRAVKTYSTGTVSATSGTRTLTGASTSWTTAEGVGKGTKMKVGTLIFTVNTVDSDTSMTVYEVPTANVSAGTAYTAIVDNPVVLLHSIIDAVLTMYYRFQRIPAVMDADNDIPDIPYPMHPLIGLGMLPMLWRQKGFTSQALEAQGAFDKQLAQWLVRYSLPIMERTYPLHPFTIQRTIQEARWPAGTGIPLSR
jgi:hypothetical protein